MDKDKLLIHYRDIRGQIFVKDVEKMETLQRKNQRLEEKIKEMSRKVKSRGTKIKFLKERIKELQRQKIKAETAVFEMPDMQRRLDQLNKENVKLKQDIRKKKWHEQEEDEKRKREKEKMVQKTRVQKEKDDWEKRILGVGKCLEFHEEGTEDVSVVDVSFRPKSAPLLKLRPSTGRRSPSNNQNKPILSRIATLSPTFLQNFPEGKKARQKMNQRQEKIILSETQSGSLSSITNTSYRPISREKSLPNIPAKPRREKTKVLVWGDVDKGAVDKGDGNKTLAVGDHVLTNLHSECSTHGHLEKQHPGTIKFIGFVAGNEEDIYIGVRLYDEAGYTDGFVQGKRYFQCEKERGVFVPLKDIVKLRSNLS